MKKAQGGVVETVRKLAAPLAEELGYLLWDVEYVKEGADMFLRITIDKEDGITIDDCEAMHRAIDPVLDEADPIEGSYHLEISSPGIERELKEDWQIRAFIESPIEVRLYAPIDGAKRYRGILAELSDAGVTVACEDGAERLFPQSAVASLRTLYLFDED